MKLTIQNLIRIALIMWILTMLRSSMSHTSENLSVITPDVQTATDPSPEVLSLLSSTETASESGGVPPQHYKVTKVIDGDTIQLQIGDKNETVRLIGIDTPESVDPKKPQECFAKEASNKAREIMTDKMLTTERDETQGERDKYGRLLLYVFLEDGTMINKYLIETGYGHEYTYKTPYKYREDFKIAEGAARENKRGLWADSACVMTQTQQITVTAAPLTTNVTSSPTMTKTQTVSNGSCGSKTKCGEMSDCAEARHYLENCGVSRLDADKDGMPCESICN